MTDPVRFEARRRSVARGDHHATVVEMAGDLVITTGEALAGEVESALEEGEGPIVVDASGLDHIDTAGLALMVRLHRRCAGRDRELVLAGLGEAFEEIVDDLRLGDLVRLVDDVEEVFRPASR